MNRRIKRAASVALVIGVAVMGFAAMVSSVDGAVRRHALKSTNLTGVRHQALSIFPRGSRLQDAATRLVDMGFTCEPLQHTMPDISSPSLLCGSNGRGYPDYPAINVTVVSRNGLISDIEVWNIISRADSDTDVDLTRPGIRQTDYNLGDSTGSAASS